MTEIDYLVILCVGVGIFLGGFVAYCTPKIYEAVGITVMLLGILVMLVALIARDLAGFTTSPFQL